jgi:hypothetical protein
MCAGSSIRNPDAGFLGAAPGKKGRWIRPYNGRSRHGCTDVGEWQAAGEKSPWLGLSLWDLTRGYLLLSSLITHGITMSNAHKTQCKKRPRFSSISSASFAPDAKLLYQPLEIGELVRLGHEAFHSDRRGSRNRLFRDIGTDGQHGRHGE